MSRWGSRHPADAAGSFHNAAALVNELLTAQAENRVDAFIRKSPQLSIAGH
ncbi:MAG: hypothetical protein M5U34_37950 [Chloroflexi bacterium]|nr:hypothetical protein [Chloroflexota bacterium]